MGSDQRFSLKWNNYQNHLVTAFESLLGENDFVDVTLGVEGKRLSAHKMLLSACSPYFRELLKGNPCQHPIIVLRDIRYTDLHSLLQFMYNGEVNVHQDQLNSFLKAAESLKIRGLTDNEESDTQQQESKPDPVIPTASSSIKKKRGPPPDNHSPADQLHHADQPAPKRSASHPPAVPAAATKVSEPVKQEVIDVPDEPSYGSNSALVGYEGGGGGGYSRAPEEESTGMMEYTGGYDDDEAAEDHQLEPAGHHADGADYLVDTYSYESTWEGAGQDSNACEVCGKVFAVRTSLIHHVKSHDGASTACTVCGKVMSRMAHLRRHMKTHENDPHQ